MKNSIANPAVCLALVLAAGSILLLYDLGREPLYDYDEASYAQMTAETAASGDWLSIRFLDRPFLEKPPLYFWLAGISQAFISDAKTAARLPSALAGIALMCAVMLIAYESTRSGYAAALAGAVLLATPPFLEAARQARLDILASACVAFAVYGFLRGLRDPRWFLLFGAMAGLAVLAKSVLVIFAVVGALFMAVFLRRFDWLRSGYFWGGATLAALIAAPWHVYMTARFGAEFWGTYIGFSVLDRASQNLFAGVPPTDSYLQYLFTLGLPWSILFIVLALTMPLFVPAVDERTRRLTIAFLALTFLITVLFFASATQVPSYLQPAYPFMAVSIALCLWSLRAAAGLKPSQAVLGLALLFGAAFPYAIYNAYHQSPYYARQVELGQDEVNIAAVVATRADQPFYAFATEQVETVIYYSGNIRGWKLPAGFTPSVGTYIIVPKEKHAEFFAAHPDFSTGSAYEGKRLLLLEVLSED